MGIKAALDQFKKENKASEFVPLAGHITPHIVETVYGDLLVCFELSGIPFESKGIEQRELYKRSLNALYKQIYRPDLCVHTHLIRRFARPDFNPDLKNDFARFMHDSYFRNQHNGFMINRLFFSLLIRVADYVPVSFFKKKDQHKISVVRKRAIAELEDLITLIQSGLSAYGPELLGIRTEQSKNGHKTIHYSEVAEFYSLILNHTPHKIPIGSFSLAQAVANQRLLFGRESFEIRRTAGQIFGAGLGIRDYPGVTYPEIFQTLWSLPFELNLSQSFGMIETGRAGDLLRHQKNRLSSAVDDAVTQISELDDALDSLASRDFILGDHNLSLTVFSEDYASLPGLLSDAQTAVPELILTREDLALNAQVRSQLPGNRIYNARNAPINSENFAGLSPLYGFNTGQPNGHHWGEAHCIFKTIVNSPHYFSPHVGDFGNMVIFGMSGSGKTSLQNFLMGYSMRFGARQIVIDKDEGAKLAVLAFGGSYHALKLGVPTGFNPFDLEETADYSTFLTDLLTLLASDHQTTCSNEEIEQLSEAVQGVLLMPSGERRLSDIEPFLDAKGSLRQRLKPWLDGRLSWVFNSERDLLNIDQITGFDITPFLNNATLRTPLLAYLFYRFDRSIQEGRFIFWLDEFWRLLDDPYFEDYIKDKQKTVRKRDGMMVCTTQSPSDAIRSSIAASILEQSPTKILLPNEFADEDEYKKSLKLSDPEWAVFSLMTKDSRQFLLVQSDETSVINFDLTGQDRLLSIISGTEKNNSIVDHLIASNGGILPKNWLDTFFNQIGYSS